jgi:hypothetical protein
VLKLMNDAYEIFSMFATILKESKKEGCEYDDSEINEKCQQYAILCMLWDGAFS